MDHIAPPSDTANVELDEPLLTADQVADLLAVPRSSVDEYARRLRNPLPSVEVGRHRRFHRTDVAVWVARSRSSHAKSTDL